MMARKISCKSILLSFVVLSVTLLVGSAEDVASQDKADQEGTRWAVLIAGTQTFWNYRHQADVCHAYQVLKEGGLKDENIIVLMLDDIAFSKWNPKKGTVVNKPNGPDVYPGIPKDYTGEHVNKGNLFAVLTGNASALTGGSGKVLKSGPNDHVFINFVSHGEPGFLLMPNDERIYADELIEVLKRMHSMKSYKRLLFYLEACYSASIFDGLLSSNLSIYATTAANATEPSYGTYCLHGEYTYNECLADQYNAAWMEDTESVDRSKRTLREQFEIVKKRAWYGNLQNGRSQVTQHGDLSLGALTLDHFLGSAPASSNDIVVSLGSLLMGGPRKVVDYSDLELVHLQQQVEQALVGSEKRQKAQLQLDQALASRVYWDNSMLKIAELVFGDGHAAQMLTAITSLGKPIVEDWDCLRDLTSLVERHCGPMTEYSMKYTGLMANMCNNGVDRRQLDEVCAASCNS